METSTLDTTTAVDDFINEIGEKLDMAVRAALETKRKHIQFQRLFPFDFLNLDFCDHYYPKAPDVMRIHSTIEKLLD